VTISFHCVDSFPKSLTGGKSLVIFPVNVSAVLVMTAHRRTGQVTTENLSVWDYSVS